MNSIKTADPGLEKIHALISRAARLSDVERDVLLSQEFATDASLREEVYEQLSAIYRIPTNQNIDADQTFIEDDQDASDLLGKILGDYRLQSVIGSGGTGTVYLGERADESYSSQVAVKVLTNAPLSHEARQRFVSERQILANLNHPYIARLLDGGETRTRESFFVMEYVNGQPIDRYCDQRQLTINQRLQLFVKVCEAVQYAHRNLIIHRDLKPGNILISNEGTPKLLDFGIAKLLKRDPSTPANDAAPNTRIMNRMLTPEYASPEQIRGQSVTTASDVYSLGVILYELLTGVRPYEVNAMTQLDLEHSICVVDPISPSDIVEKTKDASITSAASRKTTAIKLPTLLRGDLDAIVMKALRKEPEHRYSSVGQLMEDIQRHLNREPVFARQGNWVYYTGRFMRRYALAVTMSSLALTALVGFAIVMSVQTKRIAEQRDKAAQEKERAENVSNFLQGIFTDSDPFSRSNKQVTAKDLLDRTAERVSNDSTQLPEVRARLLAAIGKSYRHQGDVEAAIKYLESAVTLYREMKQQDTLRFASTLTDLGAAYVTSAEIEKANQNLIEARILLENSHDNHTAEYLQVLANSGSLFVRQSKLIEAKNFLEQALVLSRTLYGSHHQETADILTQLSEVFAWQADYPAAERYAREAVEILHTTLPARHPDRVNADLSLGDTLLRLGKFSEAELIVKTVLNDQVALFGEKSLRLTPTYDTLSKIQLALKEWDAAEASARKCLAIAVFRFGPGSFDTGIQHSVLAAVLLKRHRFNEAEKESSTSLKILRFTATADHQYLASAEYLLGASLVGEHKAKEAEPMLRENMARWARAEAPAWRAARTESVLGNALVQLHKPIEAAIALKHSYEVLSAKDSGSDADTVAVAKKRLDEFNRCVAEHRENHCKLSE